MTQKERLIELLCEVKCEGSDRREGGCGFRQNGKCNRIDKLDMCMIACIAERLLKNGVIVPPCKVGDKVYFLGNRYEKQGRKKVCIDYVATGEVDNIVIGDAGVSQVNVCYDDNEWIEMLDAGDFGNIAFLTKEEAEKALAEGAEKMNETEALRMAKDERDRAIYLSESSHSVGMRAINEKKASWLSWVIYLAEKALAERENNG